jgi:hypothetical protein
VQVHATYDGKKTGAIISDRPRYCKNPQLIRKWRRKPAATTTLQF